MQKSDAIKAKNDLYTALTAAGLDPKLQLNVRRALVGVGVAAESTFEFVVQVWLSQDDPGLKSLCQKLVSPTPGVKLKYEMGTVPTVPEPIPSSSKRTSKRYYQRLPIFPGVSIGTPEGATATLGCIVKKDAEMFVLTCGSSLVPPHLPEGGTVAVCQPGLLDGGHAPDMIAHLTKWDALNPMEINRSDAAIAQIIPKAKRLIKSEIDEQIPFGGTGVARTDSTIQKYGRTTGWTTGRVVDISFNGTVRMGNRSFRFVDQIVVRGFDERKKPSDFIQGGDAGSALVHLDAGRATLVGLVTASMQGGYALANPLDVVLASMGVSV